MYDLKTYFYSREFLVQHLYRNLMIVRPEIIIIQSELKQRSDCFLTRLQFHVHCLVPQVAQEKRESEINELIS